MLFHRWTGLVVTVLAAALFADTVWAQPASTGTSPVSTVAVVTFTNVRGAPEDNWIGEGIAESLAVSFGNGVHVGSILSAEQRGAEWIAQGTHERIGSRLRITALLTDTASGRVLGSALVDGAFADLFALQDQVAAQLASATEVTRLRVAPDAGRREPKLPPRSNRHPEPSTPPGSIARASPNAGFAVVPRAIIDGPPPPRLPDMVARNSQGQATMRATRVDTPIELDGRLDEAAYAATAAVSDFIQQEPNEGAPATERTDTWIFFDDNTLYIAARCWDSQPDRMIANEMRRDNLGIFQNEK